jgi:hypothetical protein
MFIAPVSQLGNDWTTRLLSARPVRAAFAIGAVALHVRLYWHCIGMAAKTDAERAILQCDLIGHAQAAPRPCRAQRLFIPEIDFQRQTEL